MQQSTNTFAKTKEKNCKISWQEVKKDGTFQDKSFMCSHPDAMWHVIQMRKSPSVIVNIKVQK